MTAASRRVAQAAAAQAEAQAQIAGATATAAAAEAQAKAGLAAIQLQMAQQKANVQTQRLGDQNKRTRKAERAEDKAQRRAVRAVARKARLQSLMERRDLLVTVVGIALSVGIALPAQIGFLATGWPIAMAIPGGIVPELLTWAFAIQGKRREDRGLSARAHHLWTWIAAGLAAGINVTHGTEQWELSFGIIAALGSLAAPILWHYYRKGRSTEDDDLTPEQRRQRRKRRRHHRDVAKIADRIKSAAVVSLTDDEAWVLAWRARHGAEPGMDARLLAHHQKAAASIGKLVANTPEGYGLSAGLDILARPVAAGQRGPLADPDAVRRSIEGAFDTAFPVDQILGTGAYLNGRQEGPQAPLPDVRHTALEKAPEESAKAVQKPSAELVRVQVKPSVPALTRSSVRTAAAMSVGARRAASVTARAVVEDPAAAEAEKSDARDYYQSEIAAGRAVSGKSLGEQFGRGKTWGHDRIAEVNGSK